MRGEEPGRAAQDYSCWNPLEMHQAEGLKEDFVSSKGKVSKKKGGQS